MNGINLLLYSKLLAHDQNLIEVGYFDVYIGPPHPEIRKYAR